MKNLVEIKGTKHGLIIYIDHTQNIEKIIESLKQSFEKANGFFQGAEFFLEPQKSISTENIKKLELICREFGLIPKSSTTSTDKYSSNDQVLNENSQGLLDDELLENSELIKGNIRNGQKVNITGNAILIGDVNPGGQISATGSIVIMGALKGVAHAGISGNEESFVIAWDFNPSQVRIAEIVARNPDSKPENTGTAEIARLNNNIIVIEKYTSGKRNLKDKN